MKRNSNLIIILVDFRVKNFNFFKSRRRERFLMQMFRRLERNPNCLDILKNKVLIKPLLFLLFILVLTFGWLPFSLEIRV